MNEPPTEPTTPSPPPPSIPPKWQQPDPGFRDAEKSSMPTWLKVVLWLLGIVVGLPVVGLLLLFGYCAMAR